MYHKLLCTCAKTFCRGCATSWFLSNFTILLDFITIFFLWLLHLLSCILTNMFMFFSCLSQYISAVPCLFCILIDITLICSMAFRMLSTHCSIIASLPVFFSSFSKSFLLLVALIFIGLLMDVRFF
ncbi:unnamed protein product [Meganyctiphanes norvegica]|uniref:NADH dehydrogenase subunit 4L n=1 Tax=Meganyctiphanes norvegica TaxID=48144 RepID=A0AAV2Q8S6_MEGNR